MLDVFVALDRRQTGIELSLALGGELLAANGPGVGTLVRLEASSEQRAKRAVLE